jgi:hypothetical protein
MRAVAAVLAAVTMTGSACAAEPPSPTAQELAAAVRTLLLSHLPTPLTSGEPGWGKQVPALVDPTQMRNHGAWRKYSVTAVNPDESLKVEVRNVVQSDSRTTFDLLVGFDAQFDFQQEIWRRGLRLYSGSTRARAKVWAAMGCEVTVKVENTKNWLPDLTLKLRVTNAQLSYSGLEVLHIAGIGGDGAKILGEALKETIKQVKPSLEKELLEKAGAALVKAGNSKEVRVSLGKLLKPGGR